MKKRKKTRSRGWMKLDNAAIIFPSVCRRPDTKVFRFSCSLTEDVAPALLDKALALTLELYPLYRCVLERGIFWYYLEQSELTPVVREEYKPLCDLLYIKGRRNLLFEVTYFKKRINLEVFHALSDGTGAIHFFQTLILYYLCLRRGTLPEPQWLDPSSAGQKTDDSFMKNYSGGEESGKKPRRAIAMKLSGPKLYEDRIGLINGIAPVSSVISAAKIRNSTVTVFLTACLLRAVAEEASERKKRRQAIIAVPVNLRRFFPSETARNFFGVTYIGYDFRGGIPDVETLCEIVKEKFSGEMTPDRMRGLLNGLSAIEHNIGVKIVPLPIKDFCLRVAHRYIAKYSTASLSNTGILRLPECLESDVSHFDVCTACSGLALCICSYGDRMSMSFTSPFAEPGIQRRFFRILAGMGIELIISADIPQNEAEG